MRLCGSVAFDVQEKIQEPTLERNTLFLREGEGDDGGARARVGRFVLRLFSFLEHTEARVHLGGYGLFRRSFGEAQFADGKPRARVFGIIADRRPECAAEDGTRGVEVTGLGFGVKDGTRVGVCPFFEELYSLFVLRKQTRGDVAREEWAEVRAGGLKAC